MIHNKFCVYKTLIIQIKFIEKKEKMLKTENIMFIFSCAYATMKPKVTLRLFSAFQGAYPGLLPETNFKSVHANCISNTPTVFHVIYTKVHRNGLTPKNVPLQIQYSCYNKVQENACFGKFTKPFRMTHFKFYQIHFGCLCRFSYLINSYTVQFYTFVSHKNT